MRHRQKYFSNEHAAQAAGQRRTGRRAETHRPPGCFGRQATHLPVVEAAGYGLAGFVALKTCPAEHIRATLRAAVDKGMPQNTKAVLAGQALHIFM